ncbi:ATP-binding protein [Planococcus sp. YIM B11945]|uniref:ATP-binding protein n=1 Tax=Planococcus sp. YIM B11945 TaxID=3435410 RepID=UPI003D7D60DA
MKRLAILTIGKTHSGKTTFAYALEKMLPNSIVIDQDNHADFINSHYNKLLPKQGPNKLKYAVSQTILDYAIHHSICHLIVSNSNLDENGRAELIDQFRQHGLTIVVVHFAILEAVLQERVKNSTRPTNIFRSATTMNSLEADYLFEIKDNAETTALIQRIFELVY